ncbi:MAG: hypothetical protein JO257_00940 [Deltaproteobacteria bacterium]|nr:hypothetical protein [Deltaproteobacteria bacterium]
MSDDPVRWIRRALIAVLVAIGWAFIAWQNKLHITAPVAFVCLGYLAVVLTIVNLWRTGAAAMAPEHEGVEAWSRPIGARGELEKEKKTLLKAIKEAEFDHQMGKLSKADADAMILTYRARAIEVIKELERFEELDMKNVDPAGRPLAKDSVRDQIAREVKARLEIAGAAKDAAKKTKARADKASKAGKPAVKVETAAAKVETAVDKVETASDKVTTDAEVETTDDKVTTDEPVDSKNAEATS